MFVLVPAWTRRHPVVDAAGDLHVQPLLDRLQQVHDQRVVRVEPAKAEAVPQAVPVRLHEFDVQPFFLEEPLLVSDEDRRLAGQAEVSDLHFGLPAHARSVRAVVASRRQRGEEACRQDRLDVGRDRPVRGSCIHRSPPIEEMGCISIHLV